MKKDTEYKAVMHDDASSMKEELKHIILQSGIAWGSGKNSKDNPYLWTMDTKSYLLDSRGIELATKLFQEKLNKYSVSAVGGLTLASHLIASSLCYDSFTSRKYDAFLVRRERKKNNMRKLIEGPDISGRDVVILDDALNEAGFVHQAIQAVTEIGCTVKGIIVLIDFEKGDSKKLREEGYAVESIFTLKELGMEPVSEEQDPDLYTLKWRYCTVNDSSYSAPKSSPYVEEDRVYVGSDQGKMLCFTFSGELVWEFLTEPHPHGVHQSPTVIGEMVLFSAYDGYLYCLNKKDGSLVWKNRLSTWSGSSPIYDADTNSIFVGTENNTRKGGLACVDFSSGKLRWEYFTNNHVPSRAACSDDVVVFGSNDCFVYCLDKRSGKLLWSFRTDDCVKGRLLIEQNRCYATSFDGYLYCLDLKSGKMLWKTKLGLSIMSGPVIFEDLVFVGTHSKQFSALNKNTGEVVWHFMTNGSIISYPTLHEGTVCFGSMDGTVYILDCLTGTLIWKFITSGRITSSPTFYKDKLFVSGNDGYLYCFSKS